MDNKAINEAAREHAKNSATVRSPEFMMLLLNAIHAERDRKVASIDEIVAFVDAFAEQRAATSPAPAVVQMTDEECDRIHMIATEEANAKAGNVSTARNMERLYIRAILSASGVRHE